MNDDFLHRIRIEPRPQFLGELRRRLQRQSDGEGPRRIGIFHRMRYLLPLALGCAFAVALMIVNDDRNGAIEPASSSIPESPVNPVSRRAPIVASVESTKGEKKGAKPLAAPVFRIAGTALLLPGIQQISRAFKSNGTFSDPVFVTADSSTAVKALCGASGAAKADAILTTRRILQQELDDCAAHGVKHVAEIKVAHEAVVLARSSIYEERALTPHELYLALAKEIPDPHHTGSWIPNPNKTWSDVDSTLPDEQIDIVGPGSYSAAWMSFQDTVLQPGCSAAPEREEYVGHCKTVRDDGVYRASPDDIRGYLDAHPNAMALMAYRNFPQGPLLAVKLGGVEPAAQNIADGSYPGARTVYLYIDKSRIYAISRFLEFNAALPSSIAPLSDSILTPLIEAEKQANHEVLMTMPDVNL